MEIRQLTIDDYQLMTSLWTKAGLSVRPQGRESKEAIAREMEASPDFFLGAYENDSLIGLVILSSDLRKGWINRLAVSPQYRHKGVAKTLISEAERILRERRLKLFAALIDDDNLASKELFRKCSYIEHHGIVYFSKREYEQI